jgi:diguanylate cyclase (GGDEF)-like protein
MKSSTVGVGTAPAGSTSLRRRAAALSARTRFASAGLALALVLGVTAPALARLLGVGAEAATFGLAAACLVALGFALGGRVDALERHSFEDPMTHVGNRRRWEERLRAELERAVRSRMPLSVLVVDVDNLKRMNDAHGHDCGDRALAVVGDVLRETCRSRDVAARLGGDEFAVLLPRTRAFEAQIVAERIRSDLARRRALIGAPLDALLTVSIGIADLESAPSTTPESLFQSADQALYAAKSAGRDRVEVKEPARVSGVIRLADARKARRGRASA